MTLLALVLALTALLGTSAEAETFQGRPLIVVDGRSDPTQPAPVVIALHGFTGTGAGFQRKTGFDRLARRDGFVVVYPSGLRRRWNDGALLRDGPDDIGYLAALIRTLVRDGRADPARIFLSGHSNGGGMAMAFGCTHPSLIAGISVVAMNMSRAAPCDTPAPLPAFFIHGQSDPIVPSEGSAPTGRHGGYLSLDATLQNWAVRNRCGTSARISVPNAHPDTVYLAYRQCAARLYLLHIADHGHEWPGAPARARWLQGPATKAVDATDLSWRFFNSL